MPTSGKKARMDSQIRTALLMMKNKKRVIYLCSLPLFFPLTGQADNYDRMVIQAREGNSTELLNYLAEYSTQRTLTANEIADWLQVAGWNNNDLLVQQIRDKYSLRSDLPARAYAAIASAERNRKQWARAIHYWDLALRQSPGNADYLKAKSMTEADAGQYRSAAETASLLRHQPSQIPYPLALAYLRTREQKPYDALFYTTQAEQLAPEDPEIKKNLTGLYSATRLALPALQNAEQLALPPAVLREKELDYAAGLVRNALIPVSDEKNRFRTADYALQYYHQRLTAWHDLPAARDQRLRARIDRLGAFLAREQYDEVIRDYREIIGQGHTIPDYAKPWVASALLARQQPAHARALYPRILPDPVADDQVETLFYSMTENSDYPAAEQLLARQSAHTPWKKNVWGLPVQEPNDAWLSLQALNIDYLLATGDYPAALNTSRRRAESAPGNQDLAIRYATVLSARGLDRHAEQVLKRAESLSPDNLSLETAQAYNAGSLQEWSQMESLTDDVLSRAPRATAVRQLDQYRQLHHLWELRAEAGKGLHSDNPVTGSHDLTVSARLYTPPIATNYRLFTGVQTEQSRFEEGKGRAQTPLLGLEWRGRDNHLEAELNHQTGKVPSRTGFRLYGWHDFDDHWRLSAQAARFSTEAPLRARRNNVTANSAGLALRWYQNERREYQFSLQPSEFSDGNRRLEFQLAGKERLWTAPRFSLDFTPEVSASRNSQQEVAYYSPDADLAVLPGLSLNHQIYQHYDTEWTQQIVAGAGVYQQDHYGRGTLLRLGYGQRVQWNQRFETGAMLTWGRQPWDGQYENTLSAQFDMTLRF